MQIRALTPALLAVALVPLAAMPPAAQAQGIRRCNGPDGTTIFTDRSCESFGATLAREMTDVGRGTWAAAPGSIGVNGAVGGFAIRGCARSLGELISGVRSAVEAGDVNRLANFYHWTGTSSGTSIGLMDRLEKVAGHTLASAQFDYPEPPAPYYATDYPPDQPGRATLVHPAQPAAHGAGTSYLDRYRPQNDDVPMLARGVDLPAPPEASRANPRPVALRVNDGGGGSTRFNLRQNAGCWFIQF